MLFNYLFFISVIYNLNVTTTLADKTVTKTIIKTTTAFKTITSTVQSSPSIVIVNGNMEAADNAFYWNPYIVHDETFESVSVVAGQGRGGSKGAVFRVKGPGNLTGLEVQIFQRISGPPEKAYHLSFWVRTSTSAAAMKPCHVVVSSPLGLQRTGPGLDLIKGCWTVTNLGSMWQQYSGNYFAGIGEEMTVGLALSCDTQPNEVASVVIDDVVVSRI